MATLFAYNEAGCAVHDALPFAECMGTPGDGMYRWINLEGRDLPDFQAMVGTLDLHPLMVEDMHNQSQLPKFEAFENISFLSIQMVRRHGISKEAFTEHLSILVGSNFIITVQENQLGDVFENVRIKLKNNAKRVAKNGIDYLFLSLVDAIVDEYLHAIADLRQPIEDMELQMVRKPGLNFMAKIISYKSELNSLRKFTTPLREEMQRIRIENPELIKKQNHALFRDILDHLNTLNANFESFREMLRDLTDLHNSNQNLMLNNTMKTLTVISAIFIPLTFIVGVYGMNFDFMPELHWKYGYLFIWVMMLVLSGALIFYMRRKRWF